MNKNSPRILAIIPARLSSTRFPNKPLANIAGKSLVQRVWEQARLASCCSRVVIATEDAAIEEHARGFGADVVLTSAKPRTGSDRVAEALNLLTLGDSSLQFDLVANVQGDMPFINPLVIDQVGIELFKSDSTFGMATAVTPIYDQAEFERPAAVKCVFATTGAALYFSRAAIPFWRAKHPQDGKTPWGYKHLGLYIFRPECLKLLPSLPESPLEQAEGLEQLRALEAGVKIKVVPIAREQLEPSIEVDTPEDLERAIKACAREL